tara:strand:+ start:1921 stop:4338 length:2418 start_codon:yes stop_codon:yes gene_type:complete
LISTVTSLLDSALDYANRGWYVFPLKQGSKIPFLKWKDEATRDEEKIKAWWAKNPNYNIAIVTGEKSGIIAMDIDPRSGGTETLFELVTKHEALPHTTAFKTGGGGMHYIFQHPNFKVTTTSNVFEGIDSKGDGGYIIAPPSLHASGKRYEVQTIGTLAQAPTWWAEKVKAPEKIVIEGVRKIIEKPFPAEKYLQGDPITKGGRDETLYKMGCSMRRYGLDKDEIFNVLSEVNETRCIPSLSIKDIARIAESASKFEAGVVVPVEFGKEQIEFSVEGINAPHHYQIDWDGISYTSYKKNIPTTRKIFSVPVEITRRLRNVDTGEEKIEISFYRDKKWISVIASRSTVFNASKIIELSNRGLPVSSANAKDLVRYLTDFEASNLEREAETCASRFGWLGEHTFLPRVNDEGIQIDAIDSFKKGYVCSGGVSEWVETVRPVLNFPIARFMLASSFASPLLKILNVRSFVVYAYGRSGGGKSTALKVALSPWGNPTDTITKFGDTTVSIERRASFLCNVPLGLDERQSERDQQKVEQLVYMLANGQSKGRGTKESAGIQEQSTWDLVTIATGEDSLTSYHSKGGIVTRTIEIFGRPIDNDDLSASLHAKLEDTHGTSGAEFVRRILNIKGEIKKLFDAVKDDLRTVHGENIGTHLSIVSAVLVADYYMHKFFFGKDDLADSLHLASSVLSDLVTRDDMDDAKRAYEAFQSWFYVNQSSFTDFAKEEYGWTNNTPADYVYIYPTIFNKAMKELGFNERRIKQEWAQRDWIKTEVRGNEGKRRLTVREWRSDKNEIISVVAVRMGKGGHK